jgi:hypothetical protein
MRNPIVKVAGVIVEAMPRVPSEKYPKIPLMLYNSAVPLLRALFSSNVANFIVDLDDRACRLSNSYGGILFCVLKDKDSYCSRTLAEISPRQVLDFHVGYFYLT